MNEPALSGPVQIEAPAPETSGRQASLWSDARRELRRNKLFLVAALVLIVLAVMAAFPSLFSSITPTDVGACQLANSKLGPRADAWFGNDIQGCDHYANVIYGARVSMIIGLVVGLAMAMGVALYISKVPVPFVNMIGLALFVVMLTSRASLSFLRPIPIRALTMVA